MDPSAKQGPVGSISRRLLKGPILLLLLAIAIMGGLSAWSRRGGRDGPLASVAPLNARAGVRYVGDAACVRCHEGIAKSYRQHPMGASIVPIAEAPAELHGKAAERALFSDSGLDYSLLNQGGRTIHRETRHNPSGNIIAEVEGEVRYVLGSGSHARAFLIARGDYLFQSPITWYAQEDRWGIAPGYQKLVGRFERQISPACLTCHANEVEHVEGTEGRYRPPIFRGHSIGCERCHGPGELHVARPRLTSGEESNIVNPAQLEPALREAVCQQCHLLGVSEIVRYGRELADYRPGLPLQKFVTVFVRSLANSNDHANADHVEQLHQSKCFRASAGSLGCISCHDPHELPRPDKKVAYYRDRCLECHATQGCALPRLARLEQSPEDSCIECHMPRARTSNVVHLATTHHGIVRFRQSAFEPGALPREPPPGQPALVPFHRDLMTTEELRSTGRDLGVALRGEGRRYAAVALPLLEQAHRDHPDDTLAWESIGFALWGLGRKAEALDVFESVLEQSPRRESTLVSAAQIAGALDRHERAIALWRRSIAVDRWRSDYYADLSEQLVAARDWQGATEAANQALRLSPANRTARTAQIIATLRSGNFQRARAMLDTFLEFDPPDRQGLIDWFDGLR